MTFFGGKLDNCVQGWNWVDEGRDGRHKYGYVTEEPDHDIIFVVGSLTIIIIIIIIIILIIIITTIIIIIIVIVIIIISIIIIVICVVGSLLPCMHCHH